MTHDWWPDEFRVLFTLGESTAAALKPPLTAWPSRLNEPANWLIVSCRDCWSAVST